MKRGRITLRGGMAPALAVWAALVTTGSAPAQDAASVASDTAQTASEKPWSVSGYVGHVTDYVWRGQKLADDSMQADAAIGAYGLSFDVWLNHSWDDEEVTELDYTFSYSTTLVDPVNVKFGYIHYTFPNLDEGDNTNEVFAGLSLDTILSPSFTYYYDWDQGDGSYYNLGVSHSIDTGFHGVSVDLSTGAGYNDSQWGYDASFADWLSGLGFTIPIGDYVKFTPAVFASVALDDQYDDEVYGSFFLKAEY